MLPNSIRPVLALIVVTRCLAAAEVRGDIFTARAGGSTSTGATAPVEVLNARTFGSLGSEGTCSARARPGSVLGQSYDWNPPSCVCTPQGFASTETSIFANDVLIAGPPGVIHGVLHLQLEGLFRHTEVFPWNAYVRVTPSTGGSFYQGLATYFSDGHFEADGVLAGLATTSVNTALDLAFDLNTGDSNVLPMILEPYAGGTGVGISQSSSTADFFTDRDNDGVGGLHFVNGSVAVTLPPGYSLNSAQLGIVNNVRGGGTVGVELRIAAGGGHQGHARPEPRPLTGNAHLRTAAPGSRACRTLRRRWPSGPDDRGRLAPCRCAHDPLDQPRRIGPGAERGGLLHAPSVPGPYAHEPDRDSGPGPLTTPRERRRRWDASDSPFGCGWAGIRSGGRRPEGDVVRAAPPERQAVGDGARQHAHRGGPYSRSMGRAEAGGREFAPPWTGGSIVRGHAIRALGFGLAIMTNLGFAPISSVAQTDSSATGWTFETTWFRSEKRPSILKAYSASGVLTVSATGLVFHADKQDVDIPVMAIRGVSVGQMKGDDYNDWAIVEYDEGGTRRIAGFKDGKGLGGGPNTVAIHDAVRRVMPQAASGHEAGDAPEGVKQSSSPGAVERLTWREFNQQVKQGFPSAPRVLVTDPKSMGLLVIDGDLKSGLYSFDMDGIGLVRPGEEGIFRAGSAGLLGGCVLFTGLEPGEYVVKMVRGSSGQGWAAIEVPDSPDLRIQIEAGKVHYMGQLHVKTKSVEKKQDASRESKVWARFAKRYEGTPWAALAEERSRALQGP